MYTWCRLLILLLFLPATAGALGWEQTAYLTLSSSNSVVYLEFSPTPEQEARKLMVYSSKASPAHRFCVPNLAVWDETRELRCAGSEKSQPTRIYRVIDENEAFTAEARRIFSLHQRDKTRCDAGFYAGYVYCIQGCDKDPSKLLVNVEYAECVE